MNMEEIEKIKKAIAYLKIARHSDYVTFHAMIDNETFKKEVIEPLEKIVQWNIDDEKSVVELANKFKRETQGKTLKEKGEKLKKILKVGGTIGVMSAIAGVSFVACKKIFKKNGAGK